MDPRIEGYINRIVGLFQRGVVTDNESASTIADEALDPDFFDHFELIPEPLVAGLRGIAEHAPAHPEDAFHIRLGWGPVGRNRGEVPQPA